MDPTKKRRLFNSVFSWREGLSLVGLRCENRAVIAQSIHKNNYVEIPFIIATAKRVEEWFYMEATSEYDYLTRVSDYIQRIPRSRESFQAAPVDLTAQMDMDFFRELIYDDIAVNGEHLSDGNNVLCPQQQQQSGLIEHQAGIVLGDEFQTLLDIASMDKASKL